LARTYSSSPPTPRIQSLIDEVTAHGYVVIRNAFSPASVAAAKAEVARLSADPETAGPAGAKGRNTFEGFRTQRLYALAGKSRVFDEFALHEDVLALNDWFMDPGYLINSFQSINILPGEKAQTMHYDHGYVSLERPHRPLGTVSLSFSLSLLLLLDMVVLGLSLLGSSVWLMGIAWMAWGERRVHVCELMWWTRRAS
jgi:hypothetical protein